MSIHLAQYVEDFASEIGLWKAFIEMNEELYDYALPFYDLSDYYKEDLNQVDIQFLLWYYWGCIQKTTYLPYMSQFEEASQYQYERMNEPQRYKRTQRISTDYFVSFVSFVVQMRNYW